MAVDPHADAPTVPQTNPGDEPTVPQATPSPATPTVTTPTLAVGGPPTVASPTAPMAPAQPPPPAKVAGRVIVPGASAPGQKKKAAPTTPTHVMARQDTAVEARPAGLRSPRPVTRAPGPATRSPAPYRPPRRRRSLVRRFVTALVALVLILAVPVVSAYVSYKLASGENPFEWPPTVDYDSFFPR
jgi:hypothetical protein